MRRAWEVAALATLATVPLVGQQRPRGDSAEIAVTIILAGGDPVASAWSRWVAAHTTHGAGRGATGGVWRAQVIIDTRLPATAAAQADGPVAVYAPDLSVEEAGAVARAVGDNAAPASFSGGLSGEDDTALVRMTASRPAPAVPLERPRSRMMRPALVVRAAVPVHRSDWVHTETLRYRLPAGAAAGDTVWIVVADRGTRRWVAPAVLTGSAAAAAAPTPATSSLAAPPLRVDVPLVFGVHQRPADPTLLAAGFARAVDLPAGGAALRGPGSDPALVATVRRYGITAIEVALPQAAAVSVRIVDLTGRPVTTLGPQSLDAGYWTVRWDGTRAGGARATPGVYLAITDALGVRVVTKLILAP